MAQTHTVVITDDIDGSDGAKGYTFAWQGTTYEIDLNDKHRDEILRALEPYINAGRKVAASRGRGIARSGAESGGNSAEIREWARAHGWPDLSERGRIPSEARASFFRAQGK